MKSNKKIALNTGISYIRLLLIMALSLFSTRYILLALGEIDFGIFNLIAGVVFLFTFIAGTMATTTQRFISFTMGREKNVEKVREVFYSSFVLHCIIAFFVALIVQIGGIMVIDDLLTIPEGRICDAKFVLGTVTIGVIGTIIAVPFEAVLMAHENILFVSICQICNAILKFSIALSLFLLDGDRLRLYAILMALLPFIQLSIEWVFCHNHYEEARFDLHKITDYSIFRNIGSFAGWVMIGTTCGTIRTQGSSILLNMFYGVTINAANGVATQVNSILMQFSSSITTAIRPQLIQSAGEGDKDRMLKLTYSACKYPFLLTGLFVIPLIIVMPNVLELWLRDVPFYTSVFCRLLLISLMFNQSTIGMTIALEAYGKVKLIHFFVGLSFLLVIPAGYILLKMGYPPQSVMWCIVVNEAFAAIMRIIFARIQLNISVRRYIVDVMVPCVLVIISLLIIDYFTWLYLPHDFGDLIILALITFATFILSTLVFGLKRNEKNIIRNSIIKSPLNRFKWLISIIS